MGLKKLVEFRDGSSDSDSSEMLILNDSNLHNHHQHVWMSPASSSSPGLNFDSSVNWSNPQEKTEKANQHQIDKVEEHSFYGVTDESCDFFSADRSPAMHWYNLDQSD